MKNISSFGMAFSALFAIATPAFASGAVPTVQPNDGFIQAENPEWTAAHAALTSNVPGHRQYHRDAELLRFTWLADNAWQKGTENYNNERRIMVQLRNMLHRQFHMGYDVEPTSTEPSDKGSSSMSSSSSSTVYSSSASSMSSSSSSVRTDTTAPTIVVMSPNSHAIQVGTDTYVSAIFSEGVKASTIGPNSFTLFANNSKIAGEVSLKGTTVTFIPTYSLLPFTLYTVTLTSDIQDAAGNPLARNLTWSFTTGPFTAATTNQAPASLGAAATFAVLAGSTVTNTGPTDVTGDLGVSPGTAITGFAPGIVTGGSIHATDTLAGQAMADLTTSYNDLAGRTVVPVSVSGNLGGRTLTAGLYKSTSGLEISSGDLVLDANGDANAVFIFQIASTFNMSAGRQIVLIGGAKASNIFWQVGTSANLGSSSTFKGTILADQSISLQTGANVVGRLLARIGAVTLQSNTIVVPN